MVENDNEFRHFFSNKEEVSKIPPAEIYRAWKLRILTSDELVSLSQRDMMVYFASWGLLAPTTHNSIPQKFRINGTNLDLLLDRSLVLPVSDRDGRQATISMGCVAENVLQATAAYGLNASVNFSNVEPDAVRPLKQSIRESFVNLLSIDIQGQPQEVEYYRLEQMLRRKIERGMYDEKVQLPDELQSQIHNIIQNQFPNHKIHLITERKLIQALAILQRQADTFVLGHPQFRRELADWFLPNDDYEKERGMRGHEFNLGKESTLELYQGLRGEKKLTLLDLIGFSKSGQEGIQSSSALAIVTSKNDTVANWFTAGMAFERVTLMLQKYGYSTAVYAALTERGNPLVYGVSETLKATVLKTKENPIVIFRIGVPVDNKRIKPSSKPPIETLLI